MCVKDLAMDLFAQSSSSAQQTDDSSFLDENDLEWLATV
jgi:hypothetical protein